MNALTNILSFSEIASISEAFYKSGMFPDVKSAAAAIVKVQAGQEIGIPPFQSMTGIHIIQGKPTIGAGIMSSRVKASGKYDYKVLEQSDTRCAIEFFELRNGQRESLGLSIFSADDAKKAGTQNMGKFPRNMLFARAISNGVKWYVPDVFSGPVYTPEDFNQTQDIPHEDVSSLRLDDGRANGDAAVAEAIRALGSCDNEQDFETLEAGYEGGWLSRNKAYADAKKERMEALGIAPVKEAKKPSAKASDKLQMLPEEENTDPMKVKYPTPAALEEALGNAHTVAQLADLYYTNIETIEANKALKALFSARKEKINNGEIIPA